MLAIDLLTRANWACYGHGGNQRDHQPCKFHRRDVAAVSKHWLLTGFHRQADHEFVWAFRGEKCIDTQSGGIDRWPQAVKPGFTSGDVRQEPRSQ